MDNFRARRRLEVPSSHYYFYDPERLYDYANVVSRRTFNVILSVFPLDSPKSSKSWSRCQSYFRTGCSSACPAKSRGPGWNRGCATAAGFPPRAIGPTAKDRLPNRPRPNPNCPCRIRGPSVGRTTRCAPP